MPGKKKTDPSNLQLTVREFPRIPVLSEYPKEGLMPLIRRMRGDKPPEVHVPDQEEDGVWAEEEWDWPEAQVCSMCALDGEIICCESCPASFHIQCLGLDDVPEEEHYYCPRCKKMPKGVQLFSPEKNRMSAAPEHRIANEEKRNRITVKWHYKRIKKEEGAEKRTVNETQNIVEALKSTFLNKKFMKILEMVNPVEFSLPSGYLEEKKPSIGGMLLTEREEIIGELCVQCDLQNDWTRMVKCDFCYSIWHMKCVKPPLLQFPIATYWMCPNHTEHLIESIFGETKTPKEKRKLVEKYDKTEISFETFESFCNFTRVDTMLGGIKTTNPYTYTKVYVPKETTSTLVIENPPVLTPKGQISRHQTESFDRSFLMKHISEQKSVTNTKKPLQKMKNEKFEENDDDRSVKYTEEELKRFIWPKDVNNRVSNKLELTDIEKSMELMEIEDKLKKKARACYNDLSEKDITKLLRKNLDPIEAVRGSGVRSFGPTTESDKNIEELNALIAKLGLCDDAEDKMFNSLAAAEMYRRNPPLPSAKDVEHPGILREVALSSQMEKLSGSKVYRSHPEPENLKNLVLIGYDMHFENQEERDNYCPSSMASFSKVPVSVLCGPMTSSFCVRKHRFIDETGKYQSAIIDYCSRLGWTNVVFRNGVKASTVYELEQFKNRKIFTKGLRRVQSMTNIDTEKEKKQRRLQFENEKDTETKKENPLEENKLTGLDKEETPPQCVVHDQRFSSSIKTVCPPPAKRFGYAPGSDQKRGRPRGPNYGKKKTPGKIGRPRKYEKLENDIYVKTPGKIGRPRKDRKLENDIHVNTEKNSKNCQVIGKLDGGFMPIDIDQIRRRPFDFSRNEMEAHKFKRKKLMNGLMPVASPAKMSPHSYSITPYSPDQQLKKKLTKKRPEVNGNLYQLPKRMKQDTKLIGSDSLSKTPNMYHSHNDTCHTIKRKVTYSLRPDVEDFHMEGTSTMYLVPNEVECNFERSMGTSELKKTSSLNELSHGMEGKTNVINFSNGIESSTQLKITSTQSTMDGNSTMSSSLNGHLETNGNEIESSDDEDSNETLDIETARKQAEEARRKYAKLIIKREQEWHVEAYYRTRNAVLTQWGPEKIRQLKEHNLNGRLNSIFPFEPRYFLPQEKVHAKLEFGGYHVPIAIQRALTKIGTCRSHHVQIEKYWDDFCLGMSDSHCVIIRDRFTGNFYLATEGIEYVFVNDVVVQKLEQSEKWESQNPVNSTEIICMCQQFGASVREHQRNRGILAKDGVVKLTNNSVIQVGCVKFRFTTNLP